MCLDLAQLDLGIISSQIHIGCLIYEIINR